MFIDTHAHIFSDNFEEDLDEVIQRSKEAGIGKIFMPNIDSASIEAMLELENKYSGFCHSMIGLHPCHVKEDYKKELKIIESWLEKRNFSAMGEMGTDLYWDKTFFEEQKKAFNFQAGLAKENGLPIVIHCRDSIDETIDLVDKLQDGNLTGVFHCFTGDTSQARKITDLGFLIGLGGVATFKNGGLDDMIKDVSLDSIVLETDSPYLAPTPHRGKRNEPAFMIKVAEKIASLKEVALTEVENVTTNNALRLYHVG